MARSNISRRGFGAVIGAGAVSASTLTQQTVNAAPAECGGAAGDPSRLLAPLSEGDTLGAWLLVRIGTLTDGATSIVLQDTSKTQFQLDVCARDVQAAGPRAPGQTLHFEVYLANSGDGNLRTRENHGLAAMAIADVIRSNEAQLDRSQFATLRERERLGVARSHLP